jgi:hypothetical protein
MIMARLKRLKQKIDCHEENGHFYFNDQKQVSNFKYSELLPESYRKFYEIIGTGSIDSAPLESKSHGCVIHTITLPEFYHSHDSWSLTFDGEGPFFDAADKHLLKNVLLLGYDSERKWIGFDISTQSTEVATLWDDPGVIRTIDLISYFEDVITIEGEYWSRP